MKVSKLATYFAAGVAVIGIASTDVIKTGDLSFSRALAGKVDTASCDIQQPHFNKWKNKIAVKSGAQFYSTLAKADNGICSISVDYKNQKVAEQKAISTCKIRAKNDCKIIGTFGYKFN